MFTCKRDSNMKTIYFKYQLSHRGGGCLILNVGTHGKASPPAQLLSAKFLSLGNRETSFPIALA